MTKKELIEKLKPLLNDSEILFYVQDYRGCGEGRYTYDVSIEVTSKNEAVIHIKH